MRERHFPRLCRASDAPMARQEDTRWSCEAASDSRSAGPTLVRVIPDGHGAPPDGRDQPSGPGVIGEARAVAQTRLDGDRLLDEGGSSAAERSRRIGAQIASVQ